MIKLVIMPINCSTFSLSLEYSSSFRYSRSFANNIKYSNSKDEPFAIPKNLIKLPLSI